MSCRYCEKEINLPCDMCGDELVLISKTTFTKQNNAFNAAINFAIDDDEPALFLRTWREGDWETIRNEWPAFDLAEITRG